MRRYWDVRGLLMCAQTSRFSAQVRAQAKLLVKETANNVMHIDLKLDHEQAYNEMATLLTLLDSQAGAESAAVAALRAHQRANDAFWPAQDSLKREVEQHTKRADYLTSKYLTDQQFGFYQEFVLSGDDSLRRCVIEGPPSCGKTFILIKAAIHFALGTSNSSGASGGRIVLIAHSPLLQRDMLRSRLSLSLSPSHTHTHTHTPPPSFVERRSDSGPACLV